MSVTITPSFGIAPPQPPSGVTAVAGSGQETISFTPSIYDGGSAITSYTIYTYLASNNSLFATNYGVTSSPTTITALSSNTSYYVKMSAVNAKGEGVLSAASNVITTPLPSITQYGTPTTNSTINSGTIAISVPSGVQDGDYMFVGMGASGGNRPTAPDGTWTTFAATGYSAFVAAFGRRWSTGDPTTFTFTSGINANQEVNLAVMQLYRPSNSTNTISSDGEADTGNTSSSLTVPSITATNTNDMWVAVCTSLGGISSADTLTAPSGFSAGGTVSNGSLGAPFYTILVAAKLLTASGATGTATFGSSGSSSTAQAIGVLLKIR